jgi:hypothetical protein
MPGLPRKSTKKQFTKLMKKKGKKDVSNVKPRNIATYEEFASKILNEAKHGKIEIWAKNYGEEAQLVGYATSPDAVEDLEEDFREEFDEVWHKE